MQKSALHFREFLVISLSILVLLCFFAYSSSAKVNNFEYNRSSPANDKNIDIATAGSTFEASNFYK